MAPLSEISFTLPQQLLPLDAWSLRHYQNVNVQPNRLLNKLPNFNRFILSRAHQG